MKFVSAVPLVAAAAAAAFVLPDARVFEQIALEQQEKHDGMSWWHKLPSKDKVVSEAENAIDTLGSSIEEALQILESNRDSIGLLEDELSGLDFSRPHHGHKKPKKTIYELISESKYTTKFAEAVSNYTDIVELLNSTEHNHTLFVPVDAAFEKLPHHGKTPPKEFIEAALKYHIGLGLYPAGRVLVTHTIPTALEEPMLGGAPQRLRTRVGFGGVTVNFDSKVIGVNVPATNGIVHAVNMLLVPPPFVGKELSLFPHAFSTLLLAYDKTDFVKFIHGVKTNGTTLFAPGNSAWAKLGVKANAFLFNTPTGLKYLSALLKYQIVVNATLYSDAFYENAQALASGGKNEVDLPTLLDDRPVLVTISRWGGLIDMKVNGYTRVAVQDGIAKNGVIHVVDHVPIPPHKHSGVDAYRGGEIEVEDLKARLEDYLGQEPDEAGEL